MNRNRNTARHLFVILIALTAIVGSFYMPYLAYAYENYKLNNYDIHIDTKPMIAESEQIALTEKLVAAKEALKSDSALIKINALLPQDLSFTEYANEHEIERGNSEFWQKRDIYHAGAEAYKQAVLHILTTGKAK